MTTKRCITREIQRLGTSVGEKFRDVERLRLYIIAVGTALVLLSSFYYASKQTMSAEAVKSRKFLLTKGFVTFKGHPYHVLKTSVIKGTRGRILDRSASDMGVFAQSYDRPALVFKGAEALTTKPAEAAGIFSQATDLSKEEMLRIIARKWNGYVILHNLKPYSAKMLGGLTKTYGGLAVEKRPSRTHPATTTASNVIGLMNNQDKPLFGAEKSFNYTLKAKKERFQAFTSHSMHTKLAMNIQKAQAFNPYKLDGNDVVLTLDQRIQVMAHSHLERQVKSLKAKGGAVVIMDPHTFEILAMASSPVIDMQKYKKFCVKGAPEDDGSSPCTNKAIEYAYEPGSVGKIFSLTTAIDHGVVGLKSMLNTHHGTCKVGGYQVHDTHYSKNAWITVLEATKRSSNCAFEFLGKKIGAKMMYDGLRTLGLGQRTNIDLPHESSGYIRPLKDWKKDITDAGVSYGYGYRVTPLQIAQAVSIIANNGVFDNTEINLRIQSRQGKVLWAPPNIPGRQVISPDTAAAVRKAMIAVTQKGGTGTLAVPKGYCVGGKTGTAKINIRGHYRSGHYVATFAGFAPCDKPRLVIVVMIIDPLTHRYGGSAAGPVFRELVGSVLPLMGVSPKAEGGGT